MSTFTASDLALFAAAAILGLLSIRWGQRSGRAARLHRAALKPVAPNLPINLSIPTKHRRATGRTL